MLHISQVTGTLPFNSTGNVGLEQTQSTPTIDMGQALPAGKELVNTGQTLCTNLIEKVLVGCNSMCCIP